VPPLCPPAKSAPTPTRPSPDELARLHPRLVLLDSRAAVALLTTMRDQRTPHAEFAAHADRLMALLAEEGLAHLPSVVSKTVQTPCGIYHGLALPPPSSVAVVSILRAGDALLEAARRAQPGVATGKILLQRDESDPAKRAKLYYVKLPLDIARRDVLLADPMLATGGSAIQAVEVLVGAGVRPEAIVFVNVVACPEGLAALAARWPQVTVVTAAVDSHLDENKYIVPGLVLVEA
jgi:uracil phosphoribosyltransferase